ncbi:hypothetical protein LCGC14_0316030 [marine sediment metagenome]|uniref:Uncharacterized protein n=1 Tax=marine sediment metagenome TaxID=412755 RepID=A0A0F9W7M9_9ZZZZ
MANNPALKGWDLPPTPKQIIRITNQAKELGITEPIEEQVRTRREAQHLIYDLRGKLMRQRMARK